MPPKQLRRSKTNNMIAGVAGGLGEYFGVDPTIIRLIFILAALASGSGVVLYIILWIVMPEEGSDRKTENDEQGKTETEERSDLDIRSNKPSEAQYWAGIVLVILGGLFLIQNLGFFDLFDLSRLWPLLLIFFGLYYLTRKK